MISESKERNIDLKCVNKALIFKLQKLQKIFFNKQEIWHNYMK